MKGTDLKVAPAELEAQLQRSRGGTVKPHRASGCNRVASFHLSRQTLGGGGDIGLRPGERFGWFGWSKTKHQRPWTPSVVPQRKGSRGRDLSLLLSAACDPSHPKRGSDKWLIPAPPPLPPPHHQRRSSSSYSLIGSLPPCLDGVCLFTAFCVGCLNVSVVF